MSRFTETSRAVGQALAAGFGVESRAYGRSIGDRLTQIAFPMRGAYKEKLRSRGVDLRRDASAGQIAASIALGVADIATLFIAASGAGLLPRAGYNAASHLVAGPNR